MEKMKKCFLLIVLLLSSGQVLALDQPTWIAPIELDNIAVQPNGNVYIQIDSWTPDLGCALNSRGWLQLSTSAVNFDQQFSLLLAAHMAAKKVKIYVSGCGDAFPLAQNTHLPRQ